MHKDSSLTMARRLKDLREQRGLSHVSLSAALNEKYGIEISRHSLMNYEVSDPNHSKSYINEGMRVEYLRCLADFYQVSSDYLLGFTKDPSRHPCAADDLGLSIENISYLRDPSAALGMPGTIPRINTNVRALLNDILDICREEGLHDEFQIMQHILSRIQRTAAHDRSNDLLSFGEVDEYIRRNGLFVLPAKDGAAYYADKIGALIGHSLMEKYCTPQREAVVIPTDRNESGVEDGNY